MEIQLSSEVFKQYSLFFATPMYGGSCFGTFARSVTDLCAMSVPYQLQIKLYYLFNESLITRARNYCCDEFLRSGCTHMIFVDSDIGFNAQDVLALLALQIKNPDYDIIGGPYPKKCISWEKVKVAVEKGFADENPGNLDNFIGDFVINFKPGTTHINLAEPAEVLEIGTGFMMIRRETLVKFQEAYPEYFYRPDHVRSAAFDGSREILQFFQAEIDKINDGKYWKSVLDHIKSLDNLDNVKKFIADEEKRFKVEEAKYSKRYLSEDYWFCQKVQKIGLKTWLCPWMKLQHTGTYVFSGSLVDLAQADLSMTADTSKLVGPKK